MGLINKIFGKSKHSSSSNRKTPTTFVECLDVVYAWQAQVAIDPDIMLHQDDTLMDAMNCEVECPYCSNQMFFREAIINNGPTIIVRCPSCRTEPSLIDEYEIA